MDGGAPLREMGDTDVLGRQFLGLGLAACQRGNVRGLHHRSRPGPSGTAGKPPPPRSRTSRTTPDSLQNWGPLLLT